MSTIVVGVDGSTHSQKAVEWCAGHATALNAEVVVVHAIDVVGIGAAVGPYYAATVLTEREERELHDVIERDWCKPLADAGVLFRVALISGRPAPGIMHVADHEGADLIVVGRRGRGGFAELVLGSTSHQLSHHARCPLVIIP